MDLSLEPIGVVRSCFTDKFGVPRQPGLVPTAAAHLVLFSPYSSLEAFRGLEGFSHIWITFVFHQCLEQTARLSVRPPRLGGNRKLGVFASRSGHRPNSIGISVVELIGQNQSLDEVSLMVKGVDLVDGTPVLDIKPYIPYSDAFPTARAGYAQQAPQANFEVNFSAQAMYQCEQYVAWPMLRQLITEVLSYDPRPAYMSPMTGDKRFSIRLYQFEVNWRVLVENIIEVLTIDSDAI